MTLHALTLALASALSLSTGLALAQDSAMTCEPVALDDRATVVYEVSVFRDGHELASAEVQAHPGEATTFSFPHDGEVGLVGYVWPIEQEASVLTKFGVATEWGTGEQVMQHWDEGQTALTVMTRENLQRGLTIDLDQDGLMLTLVQKTDR